MKNISKKLIIILTLLQVITITNAKETRIALIFGNSHYSNNIGTLANPANDATDMAATLKKLGFEVISGIDLKREEMFTKLDMFVDKLRASNPDTTVGLFYYAGHGMEVDGENYLLPSDAKVTYQQDISRAGIKLNRIIKTMKYSNNRLNIVVLDACRNNPLPKKPNSRSVSTGGWKEITELAEGMFIGYGTSKGREAADGNGRNGLFTKHLINNIKKPGLTIERVFKNTRIAVNKESKKLGTPQIPTSDSQLLGDFYFIPPSQSNAVASIQPTIKPNTLPAKINPAQTYSAPTRKSGDTYQDCTDCPTMVVIPSGSFQMGGNGHTEEQPIHKVSVKQFSIGETEVTFDQWDACYNSGGCKEKSYDAGMGRGSKPVIRVSWNDTQEYINWLNKITEKHYRLPSESEWEYAARAGSSSKFSWGNSIGKNNANCHANLCRDSYNKTAPVKSFKANSFGLYDMHGNLYEWVEDKYHENYKGAPIDGSVWVSGANSKYRVLRGGSWDVEDIFYMGSAARGINRPDFENNSLGFRVAMDLQP